MDNSEKRIWQYLDGELTPKQMKKVEQSIDSDPLFKSQYDAAIQMHSTLQGLPIETAPSGMMQHIMEGVAKEKIYVAKETSFIDLKYILATFGSLNLLLLGYQLLKGGANLSSGYSLSDYITKYATSMQGLQFSLPQVPSNLLPYGMALGLMLVLFWADQLANKLRPSKRRV